MVTGLGSNLSAIKALQQELKSLNDEPLEGFKVMLKDEDNLFSWDVAIFGPPGTLYEGGYFKAIMTFPHDYPYSPPAITFCSKIWHPNVYTNGKLCISILHPPGDDASSGELACERWNPTQTVRTILLSVISLLNEPNISSPANVDASVMFRKWREGNSNEYENIVRRQVTESQLEAEQDGVTVPKKVEDYIGMQQQQQHKQQSTRTDDNWYSLSADEFDLCDDDDDGSYSDDSNDNVDV